MRFTGWVDLDNDAAFITVIFICERLNIRKPITLQIDTGSSTTCLYERDAINLGININQLEKKDRPAIGIGGTADIYVLKDAKLIFINDREGWEELFEELSIIVPPENIRNKEYMKGISSLLGFDFLYRCDISFEADKAYLDLKEK